MQKYFIIEYLILSMLYTWSGLLYRFFHYLVSQICSIHGIILQFSIRLELHVGKCNLFEVQMTEEIIILVWEYTGVWAGHVHFLIESSIPHYHT